MELLLRVVDTFMLTGRGLAVWPDLPLSHGKHNAVCAVIVERPDGSKLPAEALLRVEHFSPGGYKLIVYLSALDKSEVPVGSKVWKE